MGDATGGPDAGSSQASRVPSVALSRRFDCFAALTVEPISTPAALVGITVALMSMMVLYSA